jgi:RNA polymerase sigma-70 factor (ECF subfamily)
MRQSDFEAQLPAHLPALRALARRMVGDDDDAQDVVQNALLRASRELASFREEAALKTWLFAITSRVALDHLRTAKRWSNQALIDACDARGAASVAAKFGDPSVSFDVQEHLAFCFTCVGRSLEPEQQVALVLREVLHLSHAEAAELLGVTESVLRHTLAAARTSMERQYEGLCALVNKEGPCYQCRALRELAPEGRAGRDLPSSPLPFEARLGAVRAAAGDGRLNAYFFATIKAMNER